MGKPWEAFMLVMRDELGSLLGLVGELRVGSHVNLVSEDGRLIAHAGWDRNSGFSAEVTDHESGEGRTLVSLSGRYDKGDDGFELTGEDQTGEASDPSDPRGIAALWRHMTSEMSAVE
jgi:hypothetical protein